MARQRRLPKPIFIQGNIVFAPVIAWLFLLCLPAFTFADHAVDRYVVNAAGNSFSASATHNAYLSVGEPVIGKTVNSVRVIEFGFIAQDLTPEFTKTITRTPGPTATPTPSATSSPYVSPTVTPTATQTPLPNYADFQGTIIDSRYFYVAPNPTRSEQVHFKFFLKQSADVEIRIYTPQGSHVWDINFAHYPEGWNAVTWNAAGMANGVYFYIAEAKNGSGKEKIKKNLCLIKF